jgi:regulatory protein
MPSTPLPGPGSSVLAKLKPAPANPFDTAIRLLAQRARSVVELRRTLRRKFPDDPAIPVAIERLQQLGYLDDRKFAADCASFLARQRAWGRERIRRTLQLKGVPPPAIEAALTNTFTEISEHELLERALEKKLRSLRLPLTPPRFYSLCQSLRRLGFPSDAIMKTMRSRPELGPAAEIELPEEE